MATWLPRITGGTLLIVLLASSMSAQEVRLRPSLALYLDAKGGGMSAPEGVAAAGESLLIVADTGNRRLLRYERVGSQLTPTGEIRLRQVPYPTRVRIDSQRDILALDGRSHRLVRIGVNGEFKGFVDLGGAAGPEPVMAKSFELDEEGNLYVLDVGRERILVFDGSGSLRRQIGFGPDVGFLSDLAVNGSGVVFAVDSVRKAVLAARPTDTVLAPLNEGLGADAEFPSAIVADRQGRLFIADQFGGGILILEQNGDFLGRQSAMGWKAGFLRYPTGLFAADGQLLVADRANNRIQIFTIAD